MTLTDHAPATILLSPRDATPEAPLPMLDALTAAAAAPLAARSQRPVTDVVDDWGLASFPASDPPANW